MNDSVFVTGGTTAVGSLLLSDLQDSGYRAYCLGRQEINSEASRSWSFVDLEIQGSDLPDLHASVLIHTASIWLLIGWIEKFHRCGVRRIIAFSSTSRFTKQSSASSYEREIVRKLANAEQHISGECERFGIAWTIFRPTLIYGGKGTDRNIADIARVIRKFGVFPLLGSARGLRQPVDACDLASACLKALPVAASYNKAYNLCGGETLTYRDMVARIFETLNKKPVFLPMPLFAFSLAIRVLKWHPRFSHLSASMAKRMQSDLVFDSQDAVHDFGYAPKKFLPSYLNAVAD
ncbi:MAG: NAD(P)-dependent oxidoreductase [Pseudomonadota bacterium]